MSKIINRRTFFCGTASAVAGGVFAKTVPGVPAAEAAPIPGGIIDTHTHFYDPTRPQGVPWPPKNDPLLYKPTLPEHYRRAIQGLGVTGTIVVEASPWLEDNQWLLDLAAKEPLIVGIVGNLEVGAAQFKDHLARFAKNPLFRGIRVQGRSLADGLNKQDFVGDLKRLAEADRQVDFVGGPAMLRDVARVAAKIPELRIVIDHFPFDVPEKDREEARAALRELGQLRQVFAKVSNVLRRVGDRVLADVKHYQAALDELWEVFGPDRLIYGSNWPVSERIAPYPQVLKIVAEYFAAKGKEALEKYFRGNSLAAYRWVERTNQPSPTTPKQAAF
jgi:predicted TIM-barrel fold metal-dependent hydrolase